MGNSSPFVFKRISPVITTQYPTPLSGLSADVSSLSLRDKISQKNLVVKGKVKILKTDENIRKEILEIFAFHLTLVRKGPYAICLDQWTIFKKRKKNVFAQVS